MGTEPFRATNLCKLAETLWANRGKMLKDVGRN